MLHRELSFRIGTTSYIHPDNILPNVHKLKGKVDDIELVLFESESSGNIPGAEELEELKQAAAGWDMTYTVHLPLDVDLGAEGDKGKGSAQKVAELIGQMSVLRPFAYILHLNLSREQAADVGSWQERVNRSLGVISGSLPAVARKIAVENLGFPFGYVDSLVSRNDFSICVDIGHLVVAGLDPLEHLERYFDRTRVIHLHGVSDGKDHLSLKHLDGALLRQVTRFLKDNDYRGVLTLEVFSQRDLEESLQRLWENLSL